MVEAAQRVRERARGEAEAVETPARDDIFFFTVCSLQSSSVIEQQLFSKGFNGLNCPTFLCCHIMSPFAESNTCYWSIKLQVTESHRVPLFLLVAETSRCIAKLVLPSGSHFERVILTSVQLPPCKHNFVQNSLTHDYIRKCFSDAKGWT